MNVVVTGATGFLGSRLVKGYLDHGAKVRAVARSASTMTRDDDRSLDRLEFVELDLCDLRDGLHLVEGQDLVVHTAAKMHAYTDDERAVQRRLNVEATGRLLEACRRSSVSRFIHVSTTAAIGISSDPTVPADETFRFNLTHLDLSYSGTKREAEKLVLDANGPDLRTIVVNPGVMLGPHQGDYRGREILARVLRRPVVVCTGGGLSVVHVDDVVAGIRRVGDKGRGGQRYILSGENLSFREIATAVCQVSGKRRIVISIPGLARDLRALSLRFTSRSSGPTLHLDRRYAYQYYSSEKARREVGYEPRSFAAIVADALAYIRTDRGVAP